MNLINAANLRRIIPGIVVAGGSYQTGRLVAWKGDGFHDHGKVCPNRPFPGQGKGLTEAVEGTQAEGSGTTTKGSGQVSPGSIKHKTAVSVTATVAAAVTESDTSTSDGSARVSGHAHGSVHGHSNGHGQGD